VALQLGVAWTLIPLHTVFGEKSAVEGGDRLDAAAGRKLQHCEQTYAYGAMISVSVSHAYRPLICFDMTPQPCDARVAVALSMATQRMVVH
jgi:hypothetical protein